MKHLPKLKFVVEVESGHDPHKVRQKIEAQLSQHVKPTMVVKSVEPLAAGE